MRMLVVLIVGLMLSGCLVLVKDDDKSSKKGLSDKEICQMIEELVADPEISGHAREVFEKKLRICKEVKP